MLANIKKLIASGDSFTEGHGLLSPEVDSWPAKLANKLEVPFVNYGKQGMGNEHVINCALDHFFANPEDKIDSLLILGFTSFHRVEFIDPQKKTFSTIINKKKTWPIEKIFWKDHYDEMYYYKKFLRSVLLMQRFLSNENINYIMLDAFPLVPAISILQDDLVRSMTKQIDKKRYVWFLKQNMASLASPNFLPDRHPNEIGHNNIADALYKLITSDEQPFINHTQKIISKKEIKVFDNYRVIKTG